jgi:hypothetical protein
MILLPFVFIALAIAGIGFVIYRNQVNPNQPTFVDTIPRSVWFMLGLILLTPVPFVARAMTDPMPDAAGAGTLLFEGLGAIVLVLWACLIWRISFELGFFISRLLAQRGVRR